MINKVVSAIVCLVLLTHLSKTCWAFSWTKKINERVGDLTPTTSPHINDDVLSPQEIETLLLNQETLKNYGQRPDCFRKAAGLIRTRCGELDMNEDERVNAAISMTLCELATAKHHSIPFECAPFTVGSAFSSSGPHSPGECVDALSRSAQFWSSYSGYLREVPQLCFAFRRWNDIDTAREIYRNITLEKAALIQYMLSREKRSNLIMRDWENHLRNMQETTSKMQATTSVLDIAVQDYRLHLPKEFDNALEVFTSAIADLEARQVERAYSLLHQTETSLARVTQHHSQGLQQLMTPLELALIKHVDSVYTQSRADNQLSRDLVFEAQQQWADLTSQINDLTHSIIILSSTASGITTMFNDSTQQAKRLHRLHHETSDSVTQLAETVMQLTSTTHAELEKINSSAAFIQERLLFQDYGNFRLVTRVLTFFLPTALTSFHHFNNLPVFRIVLTLLDLVGLFSRVALSGIMAISIILFSHRKCLTYFIHSIAKPKLSLQPPAPPLNPSHCISCPPSSLYHLNLTQAPASATPILRHQRLRASRIPERLLRAST